MNTRQLLEKLVAIPSVTGQLSANNQALDFIEQYLHERGLYIYRTEHNGFGALLATTKPTKTPRIMLVGHADVVAAPQRHFAVRESTGKLYGRGVLDMKSGIAGYMAAIDLLPGTPADYDFGILITTDEEGLDLGVAHMIQEGCYPTQAAVLLDGAYDWRIEIGAKAALCMVATAQGTNGHGSRPWQADSASMRMVRFLHDVQQLFPENAAHTNTLNISYVQTGEQSVLNQVPNSAQTTLDMRLVSNAEYDRIEAAVQDIAQKYRVEAVTAVEFRAIEHDTTNPHMQAFVRHIAQQTGQQKEGVVSYAVSDAVHFIRQGIPCVVTYPPGGGHHSDQEWIDAKALDDIPKIIAGYLQEMAANHKPLVESKIQSR